MPADELTGGILANGEIEVVGRMPRSSNATLLVDVVLEGTRTRAIYKPVRGERPLWDFDPGLHRREAAAYRLSEAMGLGAVPETVLRDGPYGEGSLQRYVEHDPAQHYFTLFEQRPDLHGALRDICAFDLVANNTDRKSGHCLLGTDGRVWAIDHGVCFSADFKLRTVIWEFAGEPMPAHLVASTARIAGHVPDEVAELLSRDEVDALRGRAEWLADGATFPHDRSGSRYPWPLV